ncbi:hypothetical protein E5554_15945 [Sphingobium sp. PAMC28499]|uniref:hypothetical protein n=1 Tax=Sphingobium sp. PAMC28499 TaxID=2565554 RepID=UPI00109E17BE|nr:hypothetical protein [Sphingobium sp. PAMC28499]QCB39185.1 hypothetical protein E5554_15945 [Sphingobium sp. PAMC28499]
MRISLAIATFVLAAPVQAQTFVGKPNYGGMSLPSNAIPIIIERKTPNDTAYSIYYSPPCLGAIRLIRGKSGKNMVAVLCDWRPYKLSFNSNMISLQEALQDINSGSLRIGGTPSDWPSLGTAVRYRVASDDYTGYEDYWRRKRDGR